MKQFLRINVYGYKFWEKAVKTRNCLSYCGRHFSGLKPVQDFQNSHNDVLSKLIVDIKNHGNIYSERCFSSISNQNNLLMNFNVQIFPEALKSLKNMYYFIFVMKSLDESFTLVKFNECTVTALEVVTYLLSQLRFSELKGLLTQRCVEEIEDNLKNRPKHLVSALAVLPQRTLRCVPIDISVSYGREDEEKTSVEITWAHYVWLKHEPEFDDDNNYFSLNAIFKSEYQRLNESSGSEMDEKGKSVSNFKTLHMAAVYNSKFVREFRNGVSDQWTISAINCKCFPNIQAYL